MTGADKEVSDLVLLLEWLDANEVKKWVDTTTTHEDVAKRWLAHRARPLTRDLGMVLVAEPSVVAAVSGDPHA